MERVVFDTNILISALLGRGPPYEAIMLVFRGKVRLITSMELFSEFLRVIKEKRFRFPQDAQERIAIVIYVLSEFIEPVSKVDIITIDETDNRVLEAALEGEAKYIVSGDKHLLELKEWKGIRILPAREFIKRLS